LGLTIRKNIKSLQGELQIILQEIDDLERQLQVMQENVAPSSAEPLQPQLPNPPHGSVADERVPSSTEAITVNHSVADKEGDGHADTGDDGIRSESGQVGGAVQPVILPSTGVNGSAVDSGGRKYKKHRKRDYINRL
jgi:hypothetical protein